MFMGKCGIAATTRTLATRFDFDARAYRTNSEEREGESKQALEMSYSRHM